MKNLLAITCLALMLVTCSGPNFDAADLKKFPSYETVQQKAFTTHSAWLNNGHYLSLARKADGWYLVELDAKSEEKEMYLFWSFETGDFLPFPHEIDVASRGPGAQNMPPNNPLMFKIIPFYGYRNWYNDVIKHFEGVALTDTLTEALARAYETKAFLESGVSYGMNGKTVKKMTHEQQDLLIQNMNRALELYKSLYEKNPEYNTIVGNAQNKYSNQCMSAYGVLKFFGDVGKADGFLRDGLYTPFLINFAKNMLSSCDKNGVLITYGDNDYFPLMYVQHKLGWRKDVALLNINLMMVDTYIDKFIETNKLKHQLDAKVYADERLNVILLNRSENVIKVGEVLSDFAGGKLAAYMQTAGSTEAYCMLRGSSLLFDNTANAPYTMSMSEGYVYKNDLFLWDILYSNGPGRPVYLASSGNWKPYMPNLKNRGLVLAFTYEPADSVMRLDTAFLEKALLSDFAFEWPHKPSLTERVTGNSYVYYFYELASAYKNAGKKDQAIQVIHKCAQTFPQQKTGVNYTFFMMARLLDECGDAAGAAAMVNQYVDVLGRELKKAKGEEKQVLLRNLQGTVTMLMGTTDKWADARKKLEDLMTVYMKEMAGPSGIPLQ